MAKRRAAEQIAKGFARDDDESSEEEQLDRGNAPPEVIAGRKIAIPRTRLRKQAEAGSASSASGSNPFGQLTRPGAGSATEPAANPFGFLGAGSKPAEPSVSQTSAGASHNPTQLKMRGLNSNFASQVAKANSASPFEDWTEMCEKYISYAKKIRTEQSTSPAAGATPSGVTPSGGFSDAGKFTSGENGADTSAAKSHITPTGFSFGSQTTNAKTFQFGDKTVNNTKTHTSQPSGGFVFNPNGAGEIKSVPEDNKNADAATPSEKPKPLFSFGADANGGAVKSTQESKPVEASKPSEPKPAFTFGGAAGGAPKFSFGSGTSSPTKVEETKETKPAFTFGASNNASKDQSDESKASKPAFQFSALSKSSEGSDAKPAFTFGAAASSKSSDESKESKPAFTFGSSSEKPDEDGKPKPAFSFGGAAAAPNKDSSAPFSFGSTSTASAESKPAFTFGGLPTAQNSNENKDSKLAFTFGGSSTGSATPTEKPKFQFGAANKTEFSFGTGTNPFGAKPDPTKGNDTKIDAAWKPNQPVKIATVDDVTGAGQQGSAGGEGEPSEEQNDPQTDLGGPGPGEEDEECVYEKKSKAFELADGEYKPLGLGFLRILVHKDTKKARALLRAEGSGRVLLNIPIRKEFNYTVVGKGQVKLLDVKPGNDSPTVYLVRVKTDEDGNELKDKLQEVKS